MSLYGNIESIYLSSVLQLLCNDKKTGVLSVRKNMIEVRIYFYEGIIIYATGSEKEYRLGYFLRKEGVVPTEVLRKCLKLSETKKQTLGKTLVEEGCIPIEELKEHMEKKVNEILYSLFLWKKGTFEFQEKKINLKGHVIIELNTMELILEASRRSDEKAALEQNELGDAGALKKLEKELDNTFVYIP